jgi:macrolide transport system ATP-binding/permease protein
MDGLIRDVSYAWRMLRKSPGFTAVAVLSLGLGIGANTTVFSFLSAFFLQPLAVEDPERVVAVFTSDYSGPLYGASSYPDYLAFRDETSVLSGLAAYTISPFSFGDVSGTDRVFGELVTEDYFAVAGLEAARGRTFDSGESAAAPTLVISDGLWRRRFDADSAIVGRAVTLNGQPFTIAGVAPAGFTGMTRGLAVDLWVPMTAPGMASRDHLERRSSHWLLLLGRLAPGVSSEAAQARLNGLAAQLQKADPDGWTDVRGKRRVATVLPESQARVFPDLRGAVLGFFALLMAVVGLVLLLACTNLASFLLARASLRRREAAVRLSLGASRGRLVRQLLAESVLLALIGGALGLLLSFWATHALMTLRPPVPLPVHLDLDLDSRVLCFDLLVSLLTGVLFGLGPALQASRADLIVALKDDSRTAVPADGAWSPRRVLVVVQTALSLVLLIGAGLFLQGLRNAQRIDPGFEADGLVLLSLDPGLAGYEEGQARVFFQELVERTGTLPGVRSVSLATEVPLSLGGSRRRISIEGYEPRPGEDMEVRSNIVGSDYFRTMGIPLVHGRDFTERDGEGAPGVAVVNESFARRYMPGEGPIGRRIQMGSSWLRVVGLARDGKYDTLGEEPTPFFYVPFLQHLGTSATLHVRGETEPEALVAAVRGVVRDLDPTVPVFDEKTMTDHLGLALLPARLAGFALVGFGLVALLLGAMGIHGVLAYWVSQRRRELGVRIALGADPRDLLWMVITQGARLAGLGILLGLAAAIAAGHVASRFLYGVGGTDPTTFVAVALALSTVALLAVSLPARRAAKVDPMEALRYE